MDKEHIEKILEKVNDKQDEICEMIWGLKDTQDTWDEAVNQINKKINEKAMEIGIVPG